MNETLTIGVTTGFMSLLCFATAIMLMSDRVWGRTYANLLKDYHRHEDHYWKQAAHNGMWERKYREAQANCEKLEKKINSMEE